ncbi:MAG: pentapeptide repeat-containing protein [Firmicutes bacterium]|jgi:uncharacterized protein YjbI with pentapeptide repeats|nr:pentapeptide repeat-containing protein [Bacillota bacterium]
MNKKEMYQKWENEILFTTLQNTVFIMQKEIQQNIEQIQKTICTEIEKLFYKAQQYEQKINYITFHIMRQDILEGIYQYHLFLYDEHWYLKKGKEIGVLNSHVIYRYYHQFYNEVLSKSNTYRSIFSIPEMEMFLMKQLNIFHYFFVEILRYAMNELTESDAYYKLKKAEHLEIQSGEYFEPCDKLYQQDTEIDYGKWKRQFLKQEDKNFCFADLKGIDLKGISANDVDLRYADVRQSDLQSIDLKGSNLQGARFQKSNLKQSNLEQTILNYACFDDADLQGTCFNNAITELDNILFMLKIYSAYCYTSFKRCRLKNASFKNAVLKYADFREADIENVDFTNAVLEKCIFSRQQLKQIVLTKQQKKQIILK